MLKVLNNELMQISNPLLSNIDNITYIDINASINCCSNFNYRFNVAGSSEYTLCTAKYTNFKGQVQPCGDKYPENCINPLGSYYFRLTEILVKINNVTTNLLDRSYNMTSATELTALIAYLKVKYPKYLINVSTGYDVNDYLFVEVNFIDLPSGIKPVSYTLSNDETCYIIEEFSCYSVVPNNVCTEWSIKFAVNNIYLLSNLVIDNEETSLDDTELNLFTTNPSTAAEILTDLLQPILDADFTVLHTPTEVTIVFKKEIQFIYGKVNNVASNFKAECSKNSKPASVFVYECLLDISNYTTIYAFNVINRLYLSPINLLDTPIKVEDMSTLITILKTKDPTLTGTVSLVKENLYNIRIETYLHAPSDVILHSENTEYKTTGFKTINITNTETPYNSNLIEYINNNLYIKPKFFNSTEKFEDGVYTIELKIVNSTNINTNKYCIFVFENYCKIVELSKIDKDKALNALLLKAAIEDAVSCGCDCSDACRLIEQLNNLLYSNQCPVYLN